MNASDSASISAKDEVHSRRSFEFVVAHVRGQLSSGAIKPGDKLPSERVMSEQLGVGRNAVREAMRNLENAGVVVLERGAKGGAFVRPGDAAKVTQAMHDMVQLGSISVDEMTELRICMFDAVVRLACERATDDDFAAMQVLVERLATTIDDKTPERRVSYSFEFYRLLAAATKNGAITMVVESINNAVAQLVGPTNYPVDQLVLARTRFLTHFRRRDHAAASQELNEFLISVRNRAQQVALAR